MKQQRNPPSDPEEEIFTWRRKAPIVAVLWLVGGLAALGLAMVGFAVALLARVDQLSLHFMTTLPAIVGVGALLAAWSMSSSPFEVGVGPEGVRIESRRGSRRYGWDQIGWSTIQAVALNNRRCVKLYDVEGRTIAKLSDALDQFDVLAALIARRIAAKGDQTAARIQLGKAKRTAVFMALGGVTFLALAAAMAWMTHSEIRAERLLREKGVPGVAYIEERFLAPNGITPRLVYRVTGPDGQSATRNAEVERPVWDALAGAEAVAVLYVPDEPSISRLALGERIDDDPIKQPILGYGLPALAALVSIFFIIASGLMWRGWDIDLDSKTGRISIKRFGTGR